MAEKMTLKMVPDDASELPGDAARWKATCKRMLAAQPAQAVDVGAVREVAYAIQQHRGDKALYRALAEKLTRAIGNAQAEGWNINKRGDVWDVTYTPPTQATPNAHE